MPSFNEHLRRSVERTGQGYIELNEWLDGEHIALSQRLQRHFWIKKYSKNVQGRWGEKALKEYRSHLRDDFRAFVFTLGAILRKRLVTQKTRTSGGGVKKR